MALQRNDNICQSKDVLNQFSFPALLVTDTAYLRGHMRECYHQACDRLNNTSLGQENMDFLSSVTAALARALLELSSGRPSLASEEPEPSVAANTLGLGGRVGVVVVVVVVLIVGRLLGVHWEGTVEGGQCGHAWAVRIWPVPLVGNGLGQSTNDGHALVWDS